MTEALRAARRAAMPLVGAMVQEWRTLFPNLTVIYASENGIEVGKKPQDTEVFTIPANYFPSRPVAPITKGKK
jgi:hypothetical protein